MKKYNNNLIENFSGVWSPKPKIGIAILKLAVGGAIIGAMIGVILTALYLSIIL